MSALAAWYVLGSLISAAIFAIGIAETDGTEVLRELRVVMVIVVGALVTGFLWPLILFVFVATAVIEQRQRNKTPPED